MRLRHSQSDPLPFDLVRMERTQYMWDMIQQSRMACDDFVFDRELFDVVLCTHPFYEVGDGVGLVGVVRDSGGNGWVQMVMFDWRYAGRESLFLSIMGDIARRFDVHHFTACITQDRDNARDLAISLGFERAGTIRGGFERCGQFLDIELWSLPARKLIEQDEFDRMVVI